ncbi:MAG: dihydroorotate dehydrogenase B catalytic subunit [Desulfococcus sp. 4484_241]|nr:MAG: dihydroorotate dehydrogenase B catalytic subunit [Desulfococcus sp. 4484_241]
MSSLEVTLGALSFSNPVLTASGTFGYGSEFADAVDLDRLGGIVVKGISLQPSDGNPPPRIVETACGMLNSIGLENVGVDDFAANKLPFLKSLSCRCIVNVYGKTVEEYAILAECLDCLDGVDAIELNISCPNVKAGGMAFGVDPAAAAAVVSGARSRTGKHLMVKLSPNVSDITLIAKSVQDAGADSISLINTLAGMAIDINTRRPRLANIIGGLSGPAVKPVALRMVWETARAVEVPVVGIGGIMNAEDALEFLVAGASAVQVGTANFINPSVTMEILDGIEAFLDANGISSVTEIIGSLET